MSPEEYLDIIRPYIGDMIIGYKTWGEWKIKLTMSIIFISSKYSDKICNLPTRSNNIEIMMVNETDEIIDELFESFWQNYQKYLEE